MVKPVVVVPSGVSYSAETVRFGKAVDDTAVLFKQQVTSDVIAHSISP